MIKQGFRRLVVARASTGCRVRQYTHCVVASEAFPTSTEQLDFLEAQQERDNSMESAKLIAGALTTPNTPASASWPDRYCTRM